MKFIKLYESFEDIDSICEKYGIRYYTINSDGTVDVDDNVSLSYKRLTKLPLRFGKVSGDFNFHNNNLISLEGCPESVGVSFACNYNKLTTLKGCPQSVGGDFYFGSNRLKDLYGFPEFFDGFTYYHNNPVSEILDLFYYRFQGKLGKVIDLLNEYDVIQQDGKLVVLDRLEEVFHMLNIEIPKEINLHNYEVY